MSMVTVIAEAGVNHNGDLGRAREMIAAAADAGADYVKFQAFSADNLVSSSAATAVYQATNTGITRQADLLKTLEFSRDNFAELAELCRRHRIGFMCTPFDVEETKFLISLGMDQVKVASGELTNVPALIEFARTGLPILLSTGMATMDEVASALSKLRDHGATSVTVLHCTSIYPAPVADVNLLAMISMRDALAVPIGYSDHTLDDHVAIAAVALGACVIEKHFTMDRTLPGPDHKASLEPKELSSMIRRIRDIESALGDGIKKPSAAEVETARLVRRSWHAARDLPAGVELRADDIVLKRPAEGIAPDISPAGRRLSVAVLRDQPLREEYLS